MTHKLESRVAVITGAGSGIGKAVATDMLASGYRVVLSGRREEPLRAVAGNNPNAIVVPTDITKSDQVSQLFESVVDRWGRVDVLFNNAGIPGPAAGIDEIDSDEWDAVVALNLTASAMCARAAMKIMKTQKPQGGRIINNGSIAAHTPRPQSVAYAATKHAITGLTKSIELDGRVYGISCGQIDIGNTATELADRFSKGAGALQPDGSRRQEPTFPIEEVSRAVLFMADMPPSTNIFSLVVTAAGMPFVGRG